MVQIRWIVEDVTVALACACGAEWTVHTTTLDELDATCTACSSIGSVRGATLVFDNDASGAWGQLVDLSRTR